MTDRHQSPSYPLRLPAELKNQVTEAAAAMGRSFNAEIIARLQSTFDAPTAERVNELELELSRQRSATAVERSTAFQYSIALMAIAARVPAEAFADTPSIAAILRDAKANKNAKIIAALQEMAQDAKQALTDMDDHVATGRVKVVE